VLEIESAAEIGLGRAPVVGALFERLDAVGDFCNHAA
jgi:hypothetical protein